MKKCNHQWETKGKKDRCVKCGAARMYDPNKCDHLYARRSDDKKERCIKCGAGRPIKLHVDNIITEIPVDKIMKTVKSEAVLIEKPKRSIFRRMFSLNPEDE